MQHRHSQVFLQQHLPQGPLRGTPPKVALIGSLLVAALVLALVLTKSAILWLPLGVLAVVAAIGLRTGWGVPDAMRTTSYEVDRHGLWRQRRSRRKLLIGRAELTSVEVYRTRVNEVVRIELRSRTRQVPLEGLENMEAFVQDLHRQFPNLPLQDHRPGDPRM
jgi:hypothetical protein